MNLDIRTEKNGYSCTYRTQYIMLSLFKGDTGALLKTIVDQNRMRVQGAVAMGEAQGDW